MEVDLKVFTDFKQFVVFDSAAACGDPYERWTDETIQSMFVQGDGCVAVGTMRVFDAPVVVRMEIEAPLIGRDRTAHGVLSVQSGILGVVRGNRWRSQRGNGECASRCLPGFSGLHQSRIG